MRSPPANAGASRALTRSRVDGRSPSQGERRLSEDSGDRFTAWEDLGDPSAVWEDPGDPSPAPDDLDASSATTKGPRLASTIISTGARVATTVPSAFSTRRTSALISTEAGAM
jgi:hypothetical protein